MGLRDYLVPKRHIDLGGQTMAVRGLAFNDLAVLLELHGPAMILLFTGVVKKAQEGTLDGAAVTTIIHTALVEMPALASDIIGLANADDTTAGLVPLPWQELAKIAAVLPPVKQAEALMGIVEMTLIGEAEVKKLIEIATQMMEQTGGLWASLNLPSLGGSGASADA